MQPKAPTDYIIVALDTDSEKSALDLVEQLEDSVQFYKVGMELFFSTGPGIIKQLKSRGKKVFLDLKLNDIPETIKKSVAALAEYQVDLMTLFCDIPSLVAAKSAIHSMQAATKLLNVTVLTSMNAADLVASGISSDLNERVKFRAKMSLSHGADGIICSALDIPQMKKDLPQHTLYITPGIRLPDGHSQDQQRVATPQLALANGANHIVVGRPITKANDPFAAAHSFWNELNPK